MKISLYFRLALDNIRKNAKTYIPYILTCIITVTMFYIMKSLSVNPGLSKMIGDYMLSYILNLGTWIVGIFSLIFLFYTNSFLMKRRRKEFGIFNILGMEKRHIAAVIALETLCTAFVSLLFGLISGIIFDKLMFLLVARIIGGDVSLTFFVSSDAVAATLVVFAVIFLLILLKSVNLIRVSKPIELLHGSNTGEKMPKARWLLTLLGVILLGSGYFLALSVKNPLTSMTVFFIAVILVILGTYLLFTTGSIALLTILKKNKSYYYNTKHFISVSGMMYRMKQNAVGLANICILSTMVLVMVSSTTSLVVGMEDIMQERYPNDFCLYSYENDEITDQMVLEIKQQLGDKSANIDNEMRYAYFDIFAVYDNGIFYTDNNLMSLENSAYFLFLPLDDYNHITQSSETLDDGEILIYYDKEPFKYSEFNINENEYKIKNEPKELKSINGNLSSYIGNSYYIVIKDKDELVRLNSLISEYMDSENLASSVCSYYGFDTQLDNEEETALYKNIASVFGSEEYYCIFENRAEARDSFISLYGGLFFLGVFLGLLFTMATVLIIYYKQISEGYEDRERFEIMKKVGLSKDEIKSTIHSQILTVFFLPLIVAGIHTAVAFPMISRMLSMLNMTNVTLYLITTGVSFIAFAVIYIIIYLITAKAYYKIVSE